MLAGSLLAGLTCNLLGCRRQRAFDEQDLRALANMPSEVAIEKRFENSTYELARYPPPPKLIRLTIRQTWQIFVVERCAKKSAALSGWPTVDYW